MWSRRQAGRYQKALELAERAREIEETELGARRDRMADIYQMCAISMDEVGTAAAVTCWMLMLNIYTLLTYPICLSSEVEL